MPRPLQREKAKGTGKPGGPCHNRHNPAVGTMTQIVQPRLVAGIIAADASLLADTTKACPKRVQIHTPTGACREERCWLARVADGGRMLLAVARQDCLQPRAEGHQAALVELALPDGQ